MQREFDQSKALNSLLYIAAHAPQPGFFHICKLFYFAEKEHLGKYGRFICGDTYCALDNGPVPTRIYDLLKELDNRGNSQYLDNNAEFVEDVKKACIVEQGLVSPLVDADLDVFSESDLECLNFAITKYGSLRFTELKMLSHDKAWESTSRNQQISLESLASAVPDGKALLEYMQQT